VVVAIIIEPMLLFEWKKNQKQNQQIVLTFPSSFALIPVVCISVLYYW